MPAGIHNAASANAKSHRTHEQHRKQFSHTVAAAHVACCRSRRGCNSNTNPKKLLKPDTVLLHALTHLQATEAQTNPNGPKKPVSSLQADTIGSAASVTIAAVLTPLQTAGSVFINSAACMHHASQWHGGAKNAVLADIPRTLLI
jgi:acetoin utilization deacetylase AcuC-like enzyme